MNIAQDRNPKSGKGIVPKRPDVRQRAIKPLTGATQKTTIIMNTKTSETKEQYKARQAKEEQQYKDSKKKKNPNHRVTPNLTPRGRDILMRLQNKSLDTEGERSYTLNEDIVNSRRMNKHELAEAHRRNIEKVDKLKKDLEIMAKESERKLIETIEAKKKEKEESKEPSKLKENES